MEANTQKQGDIDGAPRFEEALANTHKEWCIKVEEISEQAFITAERAELKQAIDRGEL